MLIRSEVAVEFPHSETSHSPSKKSNIVAKMATGGVRSREIGENRLVSEGRENGDWRERLKRKGRWSGKVKQREVNDGVKMEKCGSNMIALVGDKEECVLLNKS